MIVLEYNSEQKRAYQTGQRSIIFPTLSVLLILFGIYMYSEANRGLTFTTYINTPQQDLTTKAEFDRTVVTTLPPPEGSLISVFPIFNTATIPVGWKMATLSNGMIVQHIYYEVSDERVLGWGTGRDNYRRTYTLTDETSAPALNGRLPEPAFIVKLVHLNGSLNIEVRNLNESYSSKSVLQKIILDNKEPEGRKLFEEIFDGLEKLEPPPPLSDE